MSKDLIDQNCGLGTPKYLKNSSRRRSSLLVNSSVDAEYISDGVLKIWKQLPESIRLDSSLLVLQTEYDKQCNGTNNLAFETSSDHHSSDGTRRVDDIDDLKNNSNTLKKKLFHIGWYIKISLLVCCWALFSYTLITTIEKEDFQHSVSITANEIKHLPLKNNIFDKMSITVEGPLVLDTKTNSQSKNVSIWLEIIDPQNDLRRNNSKLTQVISEIWTLQLLEPELVDTIPNQKLTKIFQLSHLPTNNSNEISFVINMKTNHPEIILHLSYDLSPIDADYGIIYAATILVGLYILLVFDLVHSTIAAMLASTTSIAVLSALNQKPTMDEIISWIDVDTILLLFSMMILVAILANTGVFDYLAVFTYKISKGNIWPLLTMLYMFTAVLSAFLDNVTIILLMTPGIIRLCEVIKLNPVPVLTTIVMFSNIGGTMTPVGDPPNIIIASNRDVVDAGIDFGTFTLHMSIGVFLALIVVYGHIRFMFRNLDIIRLDEPQDIQILKQEISTWQKASSDLSIYNEDENFIRTILMQKVRILTEQLEQKLLYKSISACQFRTTLDELQQKYPIKNKTLLIKSGFVMVLVLVLFFMHSVPDFNISLGWTAFLCALLLLILADSDDLDGLISHIEWNTLLFFAALFVLMEALAKLGLITWIGEKTESVILSVNQESRLMVAILLLLWVSAIAGALFDNVPLTTMMIRIVTGLGNNTDLQLPLQPLIWALAFGTCMGGNGTLIGATSNVVCAGVAEQNGYKISFMQFLKIGFPVMMSSTMTVMVYLMISHAAFNWH